MPMPSRTAMITLTILLFEHCTTVTLTRVTQQRVDSPRPNPAVLVLITEVLKLLLASALELTPCMGLGTAAKPASLYRDVVGSPTDTLLLSVPAVLYTIQNLLIYVALGHMEIVLFQVLYQAKLILTGILSVACLGRRLSALQWTSLVVLTLGVVSVELSDGSGGGGGGGGGGTVASVRRATIGITAALTAALLSSSAGVYFEAIIKKKQQHAPSLWVRNVQLCVFTIPVAAVPVLWQWRAVRKKGLVLDVPTVVLVVLNAAGGLLVAACIKYGDNILKNFTTACSVILGTLISVVFFNFAPNLQVGVHVHLACAWA